ncbi:hypothetical protein ACFSQD_19455 [Flavihumibacter stibioxidans]|uniref:DUF4468 domain-containing protein n=1 Tax=Flavihumibacter stibioxidans TaxID=1834163 RepID=A0ABR7MBJ5_9BACT|nr:hypothetical protein [Flavihumibacter stibioxidans]MBC6492408.1 hypothetical protein [Flavihumibacter stibioxidans]
MKKILAGVAVLAATAVSLSANAQKIRLTEGDLAKLAAEKQLNLEFDYSDMKVGKLSEEEFIKKKTAEYNKKEAGKGDAWAKAWVEDRETRFEPKFIQGLTQFSGITAGVMPGAKYTLKVHTTFTEPGFNIAVMRKNSETNMEVVLVETANKDKVLAKITLDKSPGGAWFENDFDTGERISESYANAGRVLGGFIRSKAN